MFPVRPCWLQEEPQPEPETASAAADSVSEASNSTTTVGYGLGTVVAAGLAGAWAAAGLRGMVKLASRLTVTSVAAYAVITFILVPLGRWLNHLLENHSAQPAKPVAPVAAAESATPRGAHAVEAVVEMVQPSVNPFWKLLNFAARVAACLVYALLSVSISGPQPLVTAVYASLAAAAVSLIICRRRAAGIVAVVKSLAYQLLHMATAATGFLGSMTPACVHGVVLTATAVGWVKAASSWRNTLLVSIAAALAARFCPTCFSKRFSQPNLVDIVNGPGAAAVSVCGLWIWIFGPGFGALMQLFSVLFFVGWVCLLLDMDTAILQHLAGIEAARFDRWSQIVLHAKASTVFCLMLLLTHVGLVCAASGIVPAVCMVNYVIVMRRGLHCWK